MLDFLNRSRPCRQTSGLSGRFFYYRSAAFGQFFSWRTLFLGLAFCAVYLFLWALPFLLDPNIFSAMEYVVVDYFKESEVLRDLAFFAVVQLGLIACAFIVFWGIGKAFATLFHLPDSSVPFILSLTLGQMSLIFLNRQFFFMSHYFSIEGKFWLFVPVIYAALALLALGVCWRKAHFRYWPGALAIAGLLGGWAFFYPVSSPIATPRPGKTILLIGVDALSHSIFQRANQAGLMPHLAARLHTGTQYTRAYTLLGRTFPAWTTILSGEPPQQSGAIFNLRQLDKINKSGLLPRLLQRQGYATLWAIDERRFNIMDESYGFDQIIAPKKGLLDYLLERPHDHPLANFALNWLPQAWAKWLFPFAAENMVYLPSYSADYFVDDILAHTQAITQKPLFLAVHFESPHYPQQSRFARQGIPAENDTLSRHLGILPVVDDQIDRLLTGLARQGFLQDALLVFLSDHGEGFDLKEADLNLPERSELLPKGHGLDLLSDASNHIILGTLELKDGKTAQTAAQVDRQVSLLDIKAAVLNWLANGDARLTGEDCIPVETGLYFLAAKDQEHVDKAALFAEASHFYEWDSSGAIMLRESTLPGLIVSNKDFGLRCHDRISYWKRGTSRIVSFRLTPAGVIDKRIEPTPAEDIARIRAYARGYGIKLPENP
jgi:hypothetical protein